MRWRFASHSIQSIDWPRHSPSRCPVRRPSRPGRSSCSLTAIAEERVGRGGTRSLATGKATLRRPPLLLRFDLRPGLALRGVLSVGVIALLAGHFKMLRDLPANGQFNVSIDAHVDNYWAVFDRKSLIYLAEIVGPINSKALGAKADGQFFEIRLSNFSIFGRQILMDQVVPLLPDSIVVEHEHGERQVMTDRGMEISHVHHEGRVRCDVSHTLAGTGKTGAQRDAQALPNRPEVQSERPIL